jgi:hypothetical protein
MIENAAMPAIARCVLSVALDTGPIQPRVAPLPLVVMGRVDNAHVICLAYSPFETIESWWGLREAILKRGEARADHHGPQRILDAVYLLSRLRPLPTAGPILRELKRLDARGELEILAEFLPEQARRDPIWTPVHPCARMFFPISYRFSVYALGISD